VALNEDGMPETGLAAQTSVSNGNTEQDVALVEDDPGIYRGAFVTAQPGTYRIAAETGAARGETAVHVAYPARVAARASATGFLTLTRQTRGTTLERDAPIFGDPRWQWVETVIWPALLMLASLLFIVELALRYSWRP